jgi:hypothetical protein
MKLPTATQVVEFAHELPDSQLAVAEDGLALGTALQDDAFPCCTKGCCTFELVENEPTATQLVGDMHDTDDSSLPRAPTGV